MTQQEVLGSVNGTHISGHGGTNDGIIGAVAAVGLTASGWSGRFIEFGRLREFPDLVTVSELERSGIRVVSVDRDTMLPGYDDVVNTRGGCARGFGGVSRFFRCGRPALTGGKA